MLDARIRDLLDSASKSSRSLRENIRNLRAYFD